MYMFLMDQQNGTKPSHLYKTFSTYYIFFSLFLFLFCVLPGSGTQWHSELITKHEVRPFLTTCFFFFKPQVKEKMFFFNSKIWIEKGRHHDFPFFIFYVKKDKYVKETLINREAFFSMTSKCGHETR